MADWNVMQNGLRIFRGPAWRATHHQLRLEAIGINVISVYLPNHEVHELYVAGPRADEARRIVEEESHRIEKWVDPSRTESDPDLAALEVLAKRVRRFAFFFPLAPAGVVLGAIYFVQAARLGRHPAWHHDTILAWFACVLFSSLVGVGLYAWSQ